VCERDIEWDREAARGLLGFESEWVCDRGSDSADAASTHMEMIAAASARE
jgi:hypothetical protein